MPGPVAGEPTSFSEQSSEAFPKRNREWLPIFALAAVLLVLLALAATPALMLNRMVRTTALITTLMLPAYEAVRDFAYVTERRLAAARGMASTDDPRYQVELRQGKAAEDSALRVMVLHASRLGPGFSAHVDTLQQLVARRDSLEAVFAGSAAGAGPATMRDLNANNAAMLRQVQQLRDALSAVTEGLLDEDARWAARQRRIAMLLGIIAAAAAFVLGWFGLQQVQLRHTAQHALALADRRREQLERMTESRERLMRGFTHDMKNPLGAAHGYLQLLADGVMGEMTRAQARSVDRASGSITSALHMVDELMELARAESGNLAIRRVPTNLCALVRDVAEEYRGQAESKGLSFDVVIPPDAPRTFTDRRRVGQVLGNLIVNAVKYTRRGGIVIRLRATDHDAVNGRRAAISIEDTGPGIPVEMQHVLFDEFVRLDPEYTKGAGVGLTIARRIAEALQGEITVQSGQGRGSIFTLWLPLDMREPR